MKKLVCVLLTGLTCSITLGQVMPPTQAGGQSNDSARFLEFKNHVLDELSRHKVCVEAAKSMEEMGYCRPRPPQNAPNGDRPLGQQGGQR